MRRNNGSIHLFVGYQRYFLRWCGNYSRFLNIRFHNSTLLFGICTDLHLLWFMYTHAHSGMPENSVIFVCVNARAFLRLHRVRANFVLVFCMLFLMCVDVSVCVWIKLLFCWQGFYFHIEQWDGWKTRIFFFRKTSTIFPFLDRKNETNRLKSHFTHRNSHRNEYYEIKKIMFNEA